MKLKRLVLCLITLYISATVFANTALAQRKITTTLLPVTAESVPLPVTGASVSVRKDNMLEISANDSDPIKPTSLARLSFDLRDGIPNQSAILRVTLRLVGKPATPNAAQANPQLVKVFLIGSAPDAPIGQWTAVPGDSVFSVTSNTLLEAAKRLWRDTNLTLDLTSRSRLSNWVYYGLSAKDSSVKPRLIIEYVPPPFSEVVPATTTRSSHPFLSGATKVEAKPFHNEITFISNPAFYNTFLCIFGKPTSQETFLYAFVPGGILGWRKAIGDTPGSHLLATEFGFARTRENVPITVQGLYSVGENRIVLYRMAGQGATVKTVDVKDLTLSVPPTVGADGSLYFVRSGDVYGLNPHMEELWRYPAGANMVSRITLSPEQERYAYILTRRKDENKLLNDLVRIDTIDGIATRVALLDKFTDFHRPVVVKGPQQDYVVVSANSENDGTLSVYSGGELRWEEKGKVSQPNVDRAGKRVFVVQDGQVHVYDLLDGNSVCVSGGRGREAISNPVLDGDDNFIFWNNGYLEGYRNPPEPAPGETQKEAICQAFTHWGLPELPKDVELLFAPNGTLYARTATQQLFTIIPSHRAN
jgi:hypothetical protein